MTTSESLDEIRARIAAHYGILFLRTFEEQRWLDALHELATEINRRVITWSATAGMSPPPADDSLDDRDPVVLLDLLKSYPPDHLFLLQDFHPFLKDAQVVRRLRDLAEILPAENKAVLLLGPEGDVPLELRKDSLLMELPLPTFEELRDVLQGVLAEQQRGGGRGMAVNTDEEDLLLKSVLGLTSQEARRSLTRALAGKTEIDEAVYTSLIAEKRTLVAGSNLLDFYDLDEGVKDVGGLDNLKDWLKKRAQAFSPRARAQGLPNPRGVLLLGVQGCGKSLTARVTARLLSFPLVRLDVSNLLSSQLGSSERNLRDVLSMLTMIAPVVLWLDEIEKGFAGINNTQQDATLTRLVGTFLTWMAEQKAPVFVVATANEIANLPPEMLRRGRFDELFFLDLPNWHERREILGIHLLKRGWKPKKYDLSAIASQTEGFSGAELEQLVVSAMLESYGEGRLVSQEDLEHAREQIVPLSITMEERVFQLREWAQGRCRRATSDSRVTKMIEEEEREAREAAAEGKAQVFHLPDSEKVKESWAKLAEHGQLPSAVVELTRQRDRLTWCELQDALAPYVATTGEYGIALKSDLKVILWTGISSALADVVSSLLGSRRLHLHPVDLQLYKEAGKGLKLPVLTDVPEEQLARPHWLPVGLRVVPSLGASSRFGRVAKIRLTR